MTGLPVTRSEHAVARSAPAGGAWGDFLLCAGGDGSLQVGRAAEAAPGLPPSDDWSLRFQAPSAGWCGYPLTVLEDAPWRLWLLGDVYGTPASGVRELLRGLAAGRTSPRELNGHLLLLGWNEAERQWHVWTDRFGTVHAYYATSGSRASLGTHFPAVAKSASRRQLDWDAMAGFFAFGFFPQDRTFFEDVRILRPSSHYVFDGAGKLLSSGRYWNWSHQPDTRRSYDDTVEAFAGVFHEILAEMGRDRLAVPISGGLDSRSTVAGLTGPGRNVDGEMWSYSYGYAPHSPETRIARRVAAARGLPFRGLTIGPYLFDKLDRVLACVEGFQDVTQTRQAAVADLLAQDADAVVAAHWGDVWLDDMGAGEASLADGAVVDHTLAKISKRGRAWLLDKLVAPRRREPAEPLLRDFVAGELGRVADVEDADFRIKAFKTEQWSFRWTLASIRMYQAGAFPRLPFYDTRIAALFTTVPSAFVKDRRLQIDYLKRFAPDLARITWQVYGTNLYRAAHFQTWMLPARAVKKAMRLLSPRRVPERNWEIQFLSPEGRLALERHLLSERRKLHAFVAPRDVRALLDAFFASPSEDGRGYTVSMLLTLAAWLEANT